ncbi:hypothetical protein AB0L88_01355 [Saccharopolyspora shandongensis]|uniref:hypothetical protein n=1 Tax=Saccharopolyspora shandongensis TaxID=418495 RepID=UPI0034309AD7
MSDHDTTPTTVPVEPETDVIRGFLGCLMAAPASGGLFPARELVAGMRPDDAGPGVRGVAFELILRVVAAGVAPDPRVLLAEAQRTGHLDTTHKHEQFAMWLSETYRTAPFPESGWFLRTAVLEAAYRRRMREHTLRLQQATEFAAIEQLPVLAELDDDLVDLWQRLAADLARWQRDTTPGPRRIAPAGDWRAAA